jgi:hypothetical protein
MRPGFSNDYISQNDVLLYCTGWSKSLCAPDNHSTRKISQTLSITYHDNIVRIKDNRWRSCESSVPLALAVGCQADRAKTDWRKTLWTLLVTFSILIIRYTETFWSPCILSIQELIILANKTCNLPEDGVKTPKHVVVILILILHQLYVGRDSSVGKATRYGLHGPEIQSRLGRDFRHPFSPALAPTKPPMQWVQGLSRG